MNEDAETKRTNLIGKIFLYTAFVAVIATYTSTYIHNKTNPVKQNSIFNKDAYKESLMQSRTEDLDFDGKPDAIFRMYDLNENGKPDALAIYPITLKVPFKYPTPNENAVMIYINYNEDNEIDYLLLDKDNNGTLESIIKLEIKQINKQKEEIKQYIT